MNKLVLHRWFGTLDVSCRCSGLLMGIIIFICMPLIIPVVAHATTGETSSIPSITQQPAIIAFPSCKNASECAIYDLVNPMSVSASVIEPFRPNKTEWFIGSDKEQFDAVQGNLNTYTYTHADAYTYAFDPFGVKVRMHKRSESSVGYTVDYEEKYDRDGNIVEINKNTADPNGAPYAIHIEYVNSVDNLVNEIRYYGFNEATANYELTETVRSEYDSQGRLLKSVKSGLYYKNDVYSYRDDGLLDMVSSYDDNGLVYEIRRYYDSDGILLKVVYTNSQDVKIVTELLNGVMFKQTTYIGDFISRIDEQNNNIYDHNYTSISTVYQSDGSIFRTTKSKYTFFTHFDSEDNMKYDLDSASYNYYDGNGAMTGSYISAYEYVYVTDYDGYSTWKIASSTYVEYKADGSQKRSNIWTNSYDGNGNNKARIISQMSSNVTTSTSSDSFAWVKSPKGLPSIARLTAPAKFNSRTVPISIKVSTEITAAAFLLTENNEIPAYNSEGWVFEAPITYTFSADGTKLLYAWVKDADGNVYAAKPAKVVTKNLQFVIISKPPVKAVSYKGKKINVNFTAPVENTIETLTNLITASDSWITIDYSRIRFSTKYGTGSFSYYISANAATEVRSTSIKLATESYTVTQESFPCSIKAVTVTPSVVSATGGEVSVSVDVEPNSCVWWIESYKVAPDTWFKSVGNFPPIYEPQNGDAVLSGLQAANEKRSTISTSFMVVTADGKSKKKVVLKKYGAK